MDISKKHACYTAGGAILLAMVFGWAASGDDPLTIAEKQARFNEINAALVSTSPTSRSHDSVKNFYKQGSDCYVKYGLVDQNNLSDAKYVEIQFDSFSRPDFRESMPNYFPIDCNKTQDALAAMNGDLSVTYAFGFETDGGLSATSVSGGLSSFFKVKLQRGVQDIIVSPALAKQISVPDLARP